MAYTYLLGWSKLNMFYYGVRFAKNSRPEDLWIRYKTSSKYVKGFASLHGDPDIIQIRKTFNNIDKARLWEHKVLRRLKVVSKDFFLNKTDNKSIDITCSVKRGQANHNYGKLKGSNHPFYGKKHSIESIIKMQKPKSASHRNNMKGKRPHVNQKGKNNNAFKGYILTPYGKFASLKEAAIVENVNYSTIAYRIHNDNFSEYRRVA